MTNKIIQLHKKEAPDSDFLDWLKKEYGLEHVAFGLASWRYKEGKMTNLYLGAEVKFIESYDHDEIIPIQYHANQKQLDKNLQQLAKVLGMETNKVKGTYFVRFQ